MLRAVPAMIRQAWSRSRAFRSCELGLGDLADLVRRDAADLGLVRLGRARGDPGRLLQQDGRRGALGDELERAVGVDRDLDRDGRPLHLLGPLVELHHELTDVDPVLARGPGRPGGRGSPARRGTGASPSPSSPSPSSIPLEVCYAECRRRRRAPSTGPVPAGQIRSTCQYSRSTGVGRLKMISMTLTRPRASMTSSTVPSKFSNGPSLILTRSPRSTSIRTFGGFLGLGRLLAEHLVDLGLGHLGRGAVGPDEVADAGGLADGEPGLLVQLHLDHDVAGIALPLDDPLLVVADLGDLLGRDHDPAEVGAAGPGS